MGERCRRADCGRGEVVDGFCEVCRWAPRVSRTSPEGPPGGRSRIGQGVVFVPPEPERDPDDVVQEDMHVAEANRFCSRCHAPVGRDMDGAARGLDHGFCSRCRTPFDFRPKLRVDDLVEEQYEVRGTVGYGGQGWVHLAWDRRVGQLCVLKGRRDSADEAAMEDAMNELRSLASLHHPGIVKVYNTVLHPDPDAGPDDDRNPYRYLVMEYVAGRSLQQICEAPGNDGRLPVTHALAYLLAAMPALGYLHDHGSFYCDLKPENLMHSGDDLTLIDFGAAATRDRPGRPFTTTGFEAPEQRRDGPSVATDIYAAGRTLASLLLGRRWTLAVPTGPPARPTDWPLVRYDSLWRLLERACAPDPRRRFADADDLADGLLGVLHQVAAMELTTHHGGGASSDLSAESRLEPDSGPTPRPYTSDRWQPPRPQLEPFDWSALPVPVLPSQAPLPDRLAGSGDVDPLTTVRLAGEVDRLSWADLASVARAHCQLGDFDAARQALTDIDPWADDPLRRRTHLTAVVESAQAYLLGIVALAESKPAVARQRLDAAYAAAPGEPACALAFAASLEAVADADSAAGDAVDDELLLRATRLYRQVATADPTWVGATAGQARMLRRLGHTARAARVLAGVPDAHPLRVDALTLACRWLGHGALRSDNHDDADADRDRDRDRDEVADTVRRLAETAGHHVVRSNHGMSEDHRTATAELAAALYALAVEADAAGIVLDGTVGGVQPTPARLQAAQANALRRQASGTTDRGARHDLLDDAARTRPWGWLR